jgi:dephospho-CoA kinase
MKPRSCVKKVIKIAITGKIGSGKTTVCKILKEIGYKVYESDNEVEKLLKGLQVVEKVKSLYKDKIENLIDNNGNINKKELGGFLFANKKELDKLEKLLYPLLEEQKKKFIEANCNEKFIFFDIPLLFEKKMHKKFDKIIFLDVSKEIQEKRVIKRKGMSKNKLDNILNNQSYDFSIFRKFISVQLNSSGNKGLLEYELKNFLKNL